MNIKEYEMAYAAAVARGMSSDEAHDHVFAQEGGAAGQHTTIGHTSGPWVVGNHGLAVWQGLNDDTDRRICQVTDQGDVASEGGETWANARLIAAAPSLLAALQECVQYFEALPAREIEASSAAYIQSRAAIAAAKGGQS